MRGVTDVKVLAYHKISSVDKSPLTVKTEMLLRQVDYLEDKGFDFIPLEKAIFDNTSGNRCAVLTFDHGFSTDYEVIYPLLKAKGYPAIFFIVTDFIGKEGMLSFDRIRAIRRAGFSVGSHTVSHPSLTEIPFDRAKKEIEDSKKILEDCIGERVDFFAYPSAGIDEDITKAVEDAGYKAAFLISPWRIRRKFSRFRIPRCCIYQDTNFLFFKLKIL